MLSPEFAVSMDTTATWALIFYLFGLHNDAMIRKDSILGGFNIS